MYKQFLIIAVSSFFFLSTAQTHGSALTLKKLVDSIPRIMTEEHIPGLMVGITTRNWEYLSTGFGYADIESRRPVDGKTLFRMGSITKMLVSLGILNLISEGKLTLNTEIKNYAPEISFKNRWESTDPLRIVHLLEHTSGFDDNKLNRSYTLDTTEKSGYETMIFQAPSMVCRWKPGEKSSYSNPNYTVLGYIIEKITGEPYDKYLKRIILDPLVMTNSNFNITSRFPNRDVKEYVYEKGGIVNVRHVINTGGADGSLWSCSDDMLKFIRMFLNDGTPLFPESLITEMETVQGTLASKAGLNHGYALGNQEEFFNKKYTYRGHNGNIGSCVSSCFYNRKLGVGFTVASNGHGDVSKVTDLIISYLEEEFPITPVATQPLDVNSMKPFTGFYRYDSPRMQINELFDWFLYANKVYISKDTLFLRPFFAKAPVKLVQTAPYTFAKKGDNSPSVVFTKTSNGKAVQCGDFACYKKESQFLGIFKRLLVVFMICLIALSGIFTFISQIRLLKKREYKRSLFIKYLPASVAAFLALSGLKLFEFESRLSCDVNSINGQTLTVYFGTLFFGISSVVCLCAAIRNLKMKNLKRMSEWFWTATYLSVFILAVILFKAGFIGIRLWAM